MATIYTEAEQETLIESGRILAGAFKLIKAAVIAGLSLEEIDDMVYDHIDEHGAIPSFLGYKNYPNTTCISLNEVILHGIPSPRRLEEGDLMTVDIGVRYRELCTDRAESYAIGELDPEKAALKQTTRDALYAGIAEVKAGNTVGDISYALQQTAESKGYSVVREYTGHGVGHKVHEEPAIPNYGKKKTGEVLKEGMVLAIEAMVCAGSADIDLLEDGWGVYTRDGRPTCHYEHTVIVKKNGCRIITE